MTTNEIKRISALHIDKFRKEQQAFLVEGPKLFEELLHSDFMIKAVYLLPEAMKKLPDIPKNIMVVEVSPKELSRISQLKTPNQIVAEVSMKDNERQSPMINNDWIIALDNINNPGNLGTIIRTADWFGIRHIVCSYNCANFYNPKVIQSTMGSFTRINVFYTDLRQWLQDMAQKMPVYGAMMNGKSLYETDMSQKGILLIGNESHGISKELYPLITKEVKIPNYGNSAESLNASIATAIILSEIRRR